MVLPPPLLFLPLGPQPLTLLLQRLLLQISLSPLWLESCLLIPPLSLCWVALALARALR
jgi:hypothetical protein